MYSSMLAHDIPVSIIKNVSYNNTKFRRKSPLITVIKDQESSWLNEDDGCTCINY